MIIMGNKKKEDEIADDLVQGKEYEVIATKWEVSERYVQNLASKYRDLGYDIPKQGSKKFKTISLLTYEEVQSLKLG